MTNEEDKPYRVLIGEYLSVTRRVAQMAVDRSKDVRELGENLICQGL